MTAGGCCEQPRRRACFDDGAAGIAPHTAYGRGLVMMDSLRSVWRRLTPGSSTVILHAHDEGDPCDSPAGLGMGDTPRCMTFRDARTFKRVMADDRRASGRAARQGLATLELTTATPNAPPAPPAQRVALRRVGPTRAA